MRRFPGLLLCLPLLLSGCAGLETLQDAVTGLRDYFAGDDNVEPPKELQPLEPKVQMKVLWDRGVGKGADGKFVNLVPGVTDDYVFAAERDGSVAAFNRADGSKIWDVDTEFSFSSGPVANRERLILGTANAELVALNASDGALLWQTSLSSEVLSLPQLKDNMLVVRTSDGRLTGIDARTGATRWAQDRSVPALSLRERGAPHIVDDLVIDGFAGGKLLALGLADGKTAWEATVALPHGRSEIDRLVDLGTEPLLRGDTLYVTGHHTGIAAVNLKDGEVIWRREDVSSEAGMAADRRHLFVTDSESDLWELDMRNRADLWKQSDLHQRKLTAPAIIKDYLVVGDFEGYLHLLSQDDGALVGRLKIDDEPIEVTPVVFNDIIYVYTADGLLAAVSVE